MAVRGHPFRGLGPLERLAINRAVRHGVAVGRRDLAERAVAYAQIWQREPQSWTLRWVLQILDVGPFGLSAIFGIAVLSFGRGLPVGIAACAAGFLGLIPLSSRRTEQRRARAAESEKANSLLQREATLRSRRVSEM